MTDTVRNFPHSPSVKAPYALSFSYETPTCFVKPRSCKNFSCACGATDQFIWLLTPRVPASEGSQNFVQPRGAQFGSHSLSFLGMFTYLAQSMFSDVS